MARMSVDDKFLRDPRVTQLATDLRMNKWEIRGRLLAVFAITYDLERDTLQPSQIDTAAEFEGFADAMFAADLAVNTRRGLRIRGAKERIKYLGAKVEAGRIGGLRSAETRRKQAKQKSQISEAQSNPPDPVPDPPPDPVPDQIRDLPPARAIPPSTGFPDVQDRGDAALRHRQEIRSAIWRELELARQAIATEHAITAQPLLAMDPGEQALAMRLLSAKGPRELEQIAGQARHAIAVAAEEARAARPPTVEWLTGVVFEAKNFRRLVGMTVEDARRRAQERKGPRAAVPLASPAELASVRAVLERLSSESGVPWSGQGAHVSLILERLREGVPEVDLRAVVAYCADEWKGKADKQQWLRPETLFGEASIARYLDPARARYSDLIAAEKARTA